MAKLRQRLFATVAHCSKSQGSCAARLPSNYGSALFGADQLVEMRVHRGSVNQNKPLAKPFLRPLNSNLRFVKFFY